MLTLFIALAAAAIPTQPQAALAAACTPSFPAGLGGWAQAHPPEHGFAVGRAVDLPARPVANVRLAIAPTRPLSGTHYASGSFDVRAPGTYRVAAGGTTAKVRPLWLDVAGADNRALTSAAHGHGEGCNSITKVVEFRLTPGRYTFLATGLTTAAPVRVLIVRQ